MVKGKTQKNKMMTVYSSVCWLHLNEYYLLSSTEQSRCKFL